MMEAALDVDAAPLLAMQNEYDMLMAERNESFMEKLKHSLGFLHVCGVVECRAGSVCALRTSSAVGCPGRWCVIVRFPAGWCRWMNGRNSWCSPDGWLIADGR